MIEKLSAAQKKEILAFSGSAGASPEAAKIAELKKKIDGQRKASALLEQELVKNREDDMKGRFELEEMKSVIAELNTRLAAPLSVYFNAVREEPYLNGGEEYLTFSHCTINAGSAMEPSAGIFTAPTTGAQHCFEHFECLFQAATCSLSICAHMI